MRIGMANTLGRGCAPPAVPEIQFREYGLNQDYEYLFANGLLKIVARSLDGTARAFELEGHPFFYGTLFQPERLAIQGVLHPLVASFLQACVRPLMPGGREHTRQW